MPYRILAQSKTGHTVTRMDLDYRNKPITNKAVAESLAEEFAKQQKSSMEWRGIAQYYEDSIANPNFIRKNGRDD